MQHRTRQCSQAINLDSTALSVGRGRRDIENLTQAANIDIPVIAFGGTNGLAPVPGAYSAVRVEHRRVHRAELRRHAARRRSPACRIRPSRPSAASDGGFEVVMAEGFAHVDIVTAEDNADNPVPAALLAFVQRNIQ